MESKYDEHFADRANWCDVESVIHNSLVENSKDEFSWQHIYDLLQYYYRGEVKKSKRCAEKKFSHANVKTKIMFHYLRKQDWRECCRSKNDFYDKLLDELRKFERNFGSYIKLQTENDEYESKAQGIAEKLADSKEYIKIDSFNYSDFRNEKIYIRHVNGNCDDPIFGIVLTDEEEEAHPEIRRFTKTSRRVYQDSHNLNLDTLWEPAVTDSAVVFGHSLNSMDYDYFNYLFTLLKFYTFDIEKWDGLSLYIKFMIRRKGILLGTVRQIPYTIY